MEDIKEKLEEVIRTERQGIEQPLAGAQPSQGDGAEGADQRLRDLLEKMARGHWTTRPASAGARRAASSNLRDYDFMDPDARQQFEELLESLQQQVMQQYFQGLKQSLGP